MFTLEELEQFAAFAEAGTLSQAAEKLHISQPTITRTMQHLEECFKVPPVRPREEQDLSERDRALCRGAGAPSPRCSRLRPEAGTGLRPEPAHHHSQLLRPGAAVVCASRTLLRISPHDDRILPERFRQRMGRPFF